jgi:hypothetical protein
LFFCLSSFQSPQWKSKAWNICCCSGCWAFTIVEYFAQMNGGPRSVPLTSNSARL